MNIQKFSDTVTAEINEDPSFITPEQLIGMHNTMIAVGFQRKLNTERSGHVAGANTLPEWRLQQCSTIIFEGLHFDNVEEYNRYLCEKEDNNATVSHLKHINAVALIGKTAVIDKMTQLFESPRYGEETGIVGLQAYVNHATASIEAMKSTSSSTAIIFHIKKVGGPTLRTSARHNGDVEDSDTRDRNRLHLMRKTGKNIKILRTPLGNVYQKLAEDANPDELIPARKKETKYHQFGGYIYTHKLALQIGLVKSGKAAKAKVKAAIATSLAQLIAEAEAAIS